MASLKDKRVLITCGPTWIPIDDTRIIGLKPKSCLEGSVYDVAIKDPQITHWKKKGDKLYGRMIGEIPLRLL